MGMMYLFDSLQRVRQVLKGGVTKWRHKEQTYTLDAAILAEYNARPGEYLGFLCVDGKWRLFCIDKAEDDDEDGLTYITATDAAVDDLTSKVVQDKYQEDVTAKAAVEALLESTEWAIGTAESDDTKEKTDAKYVTLWDALQTVQTVFELRIVPYYVIADGEVKEKRIDILKDEPEYRGRFFESRTDASSVVVTYNQRPYTVLYGLGKSTGTGDDAAHVTFADVMWSADDGDPVDKPDGQVWVEDAAATAKYGRRERYFVSNDTEDPEELLKLTWEELQKQTSPKVTVDAVIRDMEQIKGQAWKAVRLGDKVVVKTRKGENVETRIVEIERDYLYPEQTRLIAGEELPSASKQVGNLVRAAIHTQETLTIHRNRFLEDEALIQLNAETILANAEKILIQGNEIISLQAGVDDNTAKIVLMDGRITANANAIELQAQDIVTLQAGVDDNTAKIVLMDGRITANANAIELQAQDIVTIQAGVDDNAASIELNNGRIDAQATDIINLQAGLDDSTAQIVLMDGRITANANAIELQAEDISLKADRIELQGLVTADQLAAVEASINSLTTGLTTALVLNATTINGTNVNGTYGSFDALTHNGALVSQRAITMGSLSSTGKALSTGGELDLQHSHEVTVDANGRLQLGGVAETGGNFSIAETQFYKDGVSAAAANVTLSAPDGWQGGRYVVEASNGASYPVELPKFTVSGGEIFNTQHKTTVYFFTDSVTGSLASKEVDATPVYNTGRNSVSLEKAWANGILTVTASNGKTKTAKLAKGTVTWDEAVASVLILDESAPTGYTITVDASDRYNAGWNACRDDAVSWKVLVNYYSAGETLYDVDGNEAKGPWYKGTEAYRYELPPAK